MHEISLIFDVFQRANYLLLVLQLQFFKLIAIYLNKDLRQASSLGSFRNKLEN